MKLDLTTELLPHILSLGAGVQSSTAAILAARGLIKPMPIAAVFADTQVEPASVYEWLAYLEKQLPFPVLRVTAGNLWQRALKLPRTEDGRVFSATNIPFFTRNHDGTEGKITLRSCTRDFKIKPLKKTVRRLAKIKRGQTEVGAIVWLGISADEIYRMKESREPWMRHRFPLIEMGFSRTHCLRWMKENGYPEPPRSACVMCPFHNDTEWRRLREKEPGEFQRAVEFEAQLQAGKISPKFRTTPFLHRQLVPLKEVDLRTAEERGQLNLWNNECEGLCGV